MFMPRTSPPPAHAVEAKGGARDGTSFGRANSIAHAFSGEAAEAAPTQGTTADGGGGGGGTRGMPAVAGATASGGVVDGASRTPRATRLDPRARQKHAALWAVQQRRRASAIASAASRSGSPGGTTSVGSDGERSLSPPVTRGAGTDRPAASRAVSHAASHAVGHALSRPVRGHSEVGGTTSAVPSGVQGSQGRGVLRRASGEAAGNKMAHERARDEKHGPSYAAEVRADPQGIAYAFGGLYPGTLHSHGQLVRAHEVTFSIGRAGAYKLHVALRHQGRALPGSPFALHVVPGRASARWTRLDTMTARPLVLRADAAGSARLVSYDNVGNRCVLGGVALEVTLDVTTGSARGIGHDQGGESAPAASSMVVAAHSVDERDGTYTIHWGKTGTAVWAGTSGAGGVPGGEGEACATTAVVQGGALSVMLDGKHVLGSPYSVALE